MAVGALSPVVRQQAWQLGIFSPGAQLVTQLSGTSTPQPVYLDAALVTPAANPVIADSSGRFAALYLAPVAYRMTLLDSVGATIWGPQDGIYDWAELAAASGTPTDVAGVAGTTLSAGQVAFLSDGSGGNTAGRYYPADADFTYASSLAPAIGIVITGGAVGAAVVIRVAGRVTGLSALVAGTSYYVSATAGALTSTAPANARLVGVADTTTSLVLTGTSSAASTGVHYGTAAAVTIASGVITVTNASQFYRVDTEGAAASDDLDTITAGSGIVQGDAIVLRAENVARVVTAKDGTGNLLLAGDYALSATDRVLTLVYDGTNWREQAPGSLPGLAHSGAAVTGVTFPATQVPSADANTLDDYEEGTWTPVLGGSGGTTGQTYSTQAGVYVKKGKDVTVSFEVVLTAKGTITTNLQIQGLPFTVENTAGNKAIGVCTWSNFGSSFVVMTVLLQADLGATTAGVWWTGTQDAVGDSPLAQATTTQVANNTQLRGTLVYRASA